MTEEEKYRAETFRIVGIAMLTPFGALLLTPFLLLNQLNIFGFVVYCLVSLGSLIIGATIIEAGRKILDRKGLKRWEQMN